LIKQYWVRVLSKNNFFIYYKIISNKFRGKYLDLLKEANQNGKLTFKGNLTSISGKKSFTSFTYKLKKKGWKINIGTPFGKPEKVLEYLSRYVFRVAISDKRILDVHNGKVLFSWKDYRTGLFRKMNLDIDEFIRRFLLHVLPQGFFKVRYYGIFSSRYRKENIQLAKELIEQDKLFKKEGDIEEGLTVWEKQATVWDEIMQAIPGYRKPNCPVCKKGMLHFAGIVPVSHYNSS
jgi:hypothetical protein